MRNRRRKNTKYFRMLVFVLSVLVIILAVLCFMIFHKHAENQKENLEEQTEVESETIEQESEESEVAEPVTEEEVSIEETGFIFVGESHMVVADAEYASHGSDIDGIDYGENLFFVQTGLSGWMGTAQWLTSTEIQDGEEGALLQIDSILEQHDFKKCYIFMQHGSSMSQYKDLWNTYETIYQTYEERYKQCEFYVISVPPVQEEEFLAKTGIKRSNQSIKDFNEYTRSILKEGQYLDYYDWFADDGNYQDYIHFEGSTYKSLFTSIMGNLLS